MLAIKRELKLNNKEQSFFCQSAGYSRFVYNFGLSLLKDSWSFTEVKASDSKRLGAIKKVFTNHVKARPEFSWCNDLSSRIYQNAFRDLGDAFSRWRKGLTKMPVFKSKRHQCSFTVDDANGLKLIKAGKTIKIPTLGTYRLKETIPYSCMSQTFTISREAGKWFVSFMVNAEPLPEMQHTASVVGIDLGIKCFATLSDGSVIESPKSIKQAKSKLRLFQFRNRNKQIGNRRKRIKTSKSGEQYFQRLRKKHFAIANIREDFLQKETTRLAKTYQEIKIEDLNIKGMMANHKLAEAIGTLGLYRFRELLGYKQIFHGFILTIIDRWFPSSRMCSDCGHKQDMPLKERIYQCGGCGVVKDRDLNASINIARWPTLPMAIGIRTLVDCVGSSPQVEAGIKQLSLFV
ncbi:MAG: RNA-guided endonuclease InsQ/TnpB family protein [Microcoleus sp.]